ncbi:helix-turn-helix domain-containing protein [Lachnotalea sp. AF33-28]|uniref:helix-turn-helix domain-containing protein n=1 Tax=Lachnotalea sp. AF33-28 TaxID=2292046 RepID=UPI003FA5289F
MWHLVLHFRYLAAIGKAGIFMSESNSFSHLTLQERHIILASITNGSSKTAIAGTIGKDKSTVGKEIRLHRSLTHKCNMPLECNNYRKCVFGRKCSLQLP